MNNFMDNAMNLEDIALELSRLLLTGIRGGLSTKEENLRACISRLNQSLDKDQNPQRYLDLIDKKIPEMIVYIMQLSHRTNNVVLLHEILSLLITITNNSEDFCSSLLDNKFQDVVIEHMIRPNKVMSPINVLPLLKQYLLITFNIVRYVRFRQHFRLNLNIKLFKKLVRSFVSSNENDLKISSFLIIAFLYVNDDRDEKFLGDNFVIIDLILGNISKTAKIGPTGCSVWELLNGLEALSSIGSLRYKMVAVTEFIPTLVAVISTNSSTPQDLEMAAQVLKNLCCDLSTKSTLQRKYNLNSVVDALRLSGEESVRKITDELSVVLRQTLHSVVDVKDTEYDVFVSYDIDDREAVFRVIKGLGNKFKIYVCVGSDSELDSADFADVISRSKVVLVVASMSYENNRRCLLEAIQAAQKGKQIVQLSAIHKFKPGGTLAYIVRGCENVDISDLDSLEDSLRLICHVIERSIAAPDVSRDGDHLTKMESLNLGATSVENVRADDFRSWSRADVSGWLARLNLSEIVNKFNEFDGKMLHTLKNMKEKTPEFYLKNLESSLKLSFVEILRFDSELDKLVVGESDS